MCESFLEAFREWKSQQSHDNFCVELLSDGSGVLMDFEHNLLLGQERVFEFDDISELIEFFRKD